MKIRVKVLREVIQSVLAENASVQNIAAYINYLHNDNIDNFTPNIRIAMIYDAKAAIENIKKEVENYPVSFMKDKIADIIYKSVLGMIQIQKPDDDVPSNGAWEVTNSAGRGYGKIVYGLGYAMAPNHVLMPDRSNVSPSAMNAWKKQFDTNRKHQKIDNVYDPKTPEVEDDGYVHDDPNAPYLDYTYWGDDTSIISKMGNLHVQTVDVLVDLLKKWFYNDNNKTRSEIQDSFATLPSRKFYDDM